MNVTSVSNALTRVASRSALRLRKHAPTILTYLGVGTLAAAGVVAVKKTLDVAPKIQQAKESFDAIDTSAPDAKQQATAYIALVKGVLVEYRIPIAMAVAGAGMVVLSHGRMMKRNAGLMAAYAAVDNAYSAYRDRVRKLAGDGLEESLYRGYDLKPIPRLDGEADACPRLAPDKAEFPTHRSPYAIDFGPYNKNWNSLPEYNLVFLRAVEAHAQSLLIARGHVLLNDVYDAIGAPRTPAGAVVGWMKDGPDGRVEFALPEPGSEDEADYFYYFGADSVVPLDFNVDGVIYDKL